MGNDPTETKQEESVWQVQVGEAACMMTRRELDAALAREDLDPYTLVREPGTLRWLSLGTVQGIESETMNLTSHDVEIVAADYTPSFVAPRPVPIETERQRPPEPLTKEERALVRPRGLFLPQLVLVGVAVFGGVFLAQHYLPSLSSATSFVRAHANASSTQTSVAGLASIAPPATSAPAAPASAAAPVIAEVAPPPAPPPPATRVLLATKPQAATSPAPARATSSVRPARPTAKKANPATTRNGAAAKAKPSTKTAAPKPTTKTAQKPAASKPSSAPSSTPARPPQPLKPDPVRPARPAREVGR